MAIHKIQLQNFTIFKDLTVQLSPGVNVLVGENGTGKTHFLKAIYALSRIRTSEKTDISLGNIFGVKSIDGNLQNDNAKNISICVVANDVDSIEFSIPYANGTRNYEISEPKDNYLATFIPAKDMLTHSKGLLAMMEKYRDFPFDQTLTDIISKAMQWKLKNPPEIALKIMPMLETMMDGVVEIVDEEFFIHKHDGRMVSFAVEAEGLKKVGLLWQLLMNENITEKTVLLWDEPEANLNPKFLPILVDCLLELSRYGVQIVVSTHNYIFAKYFDVKAKTEDNRLYHSFYLTEARVACESKEHFADLKHNSITATFDKLLNEVYDLNMGD